MEHGPAIVAWVIAAVEVADAVTVNVLDSVPSAVRYKRLPPYDGVNAALEANPGHDTVWLEPREHHSRIRSPATVPAALLTAKVVAEVKS
jgi:hypothetical protein